MKSRKTIFSILILSLFALSFAFAGGANEARLFYFPRNVVNNQNVSIELTQQKALTASGIKFDFENNSTDDLALFRISDSLYNSSDQPNAGGLTITISSDDNWEFVNENNPTSRRPFELKAYCIEKKRNYKSYPESNSSKVEIGASTTLPRSNATASFKKVGDVYELFIPYTSFSDVLGGKYAEYIREFDICIVIPNDDDSLESGYYQTSLSVVSGQYQEHSVSNRNLGKDGGLKRIEQTLSIRGRVGLEQATSSTNSYSFSVLSKKDTYSMDLGITSQSTPYQVANISFFYSDTTKNNPESSSNNTTFKNQFKLYLSPTRDYKVAGTYQFIKLNSENQARTDENTVYYDLYLEKNSTYQSFSDIGGSSFPTGSKIGSAGVSTPASTYYITPEFSYIQISSSSWLTGEDKWKVTWELNKDIYLKLTDETMRHTHLEGLYYTYMYVTLVVT